MTTPATVYKQANWDIPVNDNFEAASPAAAFGKKNPLTTGLTLAYYGGILDGVAYADGTHALTASTTRYVVIARATGVVSSATGTTNWNDTTNYLRMGVAVVGASTFTWTDWRQGYGGAGGGGGGSFTGGTLTSALNEAPPVTIASASTVNIGAAAGNTILVSGATTITAFDSIAAGAIRRVRFLGVLTLTHNATTLILPAATNIATAAGDVATMESLGSGNWRCVGYARQDGSAVGGGGAGTVTSVDASGGVETVSGSPITATGTVRAANFVNAQTGTTYTYVTGDRAKMVTHSNASAIAATLPVALSTFGSGWFMFVKNNGAGTLTITPTTSTIGGATTFVLTTGQWAHIVSDGSNYQVCTYAPSAGGALSNWTESVNASSPNATVPVTRFLATNAATDVDAALSPKGTGALLSSLPDSATAGGNKRGIRAVDWQLVRSAAADVASGNYATISGGRYNKATGLGAMVAGGEGNNAGNSYAFCAGAYNSATGDSSTCAGGQSNTASASYGTVGGGSTNLANGQYSTIPGGQSATTRGIYGMLAYAANQFSAQGDAQLGCYPSRVATTNATPADLTTNAGAISTNNAAILPNNSVFVFEIMVVAKVATFGDRGSYRVTGQISRGANAAATQIDGTPTVTTIATVGGASAWVVAVSADTTNGGLKVTVTGVAATNIKWVADVRTVEVVG